MKELFLIISQVMLSEFEIGYQISNAHFGIQKNVSQNIKIYMKDRAQHPIGIIRLSSLNFLLSAEMEYVRADLQTIEYNNQMISPEPNHTSSDYVSDRMETDSNSDSAKMSRKDRIRKNVTIRKTKAPAIIDSNPTTASSKLLTKEERAQIQKIKNRESAQRSRDIKKMQMHMIISENVQLKADKEQLAREVEELKRAKACWSCGASLNTQPEPLHEFQNNPHNDLNCFLEEQVTYSRVVEEDHSKLPMFIFLSTILVGVLLFGSGTTTPANKAAPQLLYSITPAVVAESQSLPPALVKKQSNTCLLESYQSKQLQLPERQLRENQLVSASYELSRLKRDILLCSDPYIIKGEPEMEGKGNSILSNLFELLLKGNELIGLLGQAASKSLSPTSMYVVLAEIKKVENYQSPKYCLV